MEQRPDLKKLSGAQLVVVLEAAGQLHQHRRESFLAAVALSLVGCADPPVMVLFTVQSELHSRIYMPRARLCCSGELTVADRQRYCAKSLIGRGYLKCFVS